jgi:hypothetical protein
MGESFTFADIVRGAVHRLQAVRLRREGYTYADSGVQLGISHELVSDELRQLRVQTGEATDDTRRLELDRLDAMTLALLIARLAAFTVQKRQ